MRRIAIGIVLATLVTYVWGFLYWGASPIPYTAWTQAADDAAAQAALRTHFPERGTYFVPGRDHPTDEMTALYQAGPVALVHMLAPAGRDPFDVGIMVKGFSLVLLSAALLALLLHRLARVLRYGELARVVVLVALLATLVVDLGDYAWWNIPGAWKLAQGVYDFTAILIPGLIVARFVTPAPGGAR
jgi:hypothetical protein